MSSCLSSPLRREKLATAIENDNYIKKLLNIFTVCEVCVFCPVLFFGVYDPSVCCMLEARRTSQADASLKELLVDGRPNQIQ